MLNPGEIHQRLLVKRVFVKWEDHEWIKAYAVLVNRLDGEESEMEFMVAK
ncbi:hypothetical protein [Prosthecobacter sp.]